MQAPQAERQPGTDTRPETRPLCREAVADAGAAPVGIVLGGIMDVGTDVAVVAMGKVRSL